MVLADAFEYFKVFSGTFGKFWVHSGTFKNVKLQNSFINRPKISESLTLFCLSLNRVKILALFKNCLVPSICGPFKNIFVWYISFHANFRFYLWHVWSIYGSSITDFGWQGEVQRGPKYADVILEQPLKHMKQHQHIYSIFILQPVNDVAKIIINKWEQDYEM